MAEKKEKTNGKKKRGRESTYDPSYAERAYYLCLLGLTNKDLAIAFGKDESTIERWCRKHEDFARALKKGKEEADGKVAESLYHRALGYSHPEEKIFMYKGEPVRVETIKHYPPDTGAAIFWLKNRQKDKWRDVWNLEHSGKDGGAIQHDIRFTDLSDFTDEELELLERVGLKIARDSKKSESEERMDE